MLTIEELHALGHAKALEAERARLYTQADDLQAPIALKVIKAINALPNGGSFKPLQPLMMTIEQFPDGFYRSELRTALNLKGPWTP